MPFLLLFHAGLQAFQGFCTPIGGGGGGGGGVMCGGVMV
jgi:hypothetical protein